ncbi:hypothetical protein DCAR_0101044 [Daucus carota subsp. sativus]|uniref:Uncharacterized protein n=1 Tax=Daucus carota subsp. sativus TaxID=79200 RepID=A0A175YBM7_DAUCS|nr:hypothetical protein DCAR_0101044 [Daucus carota subsp. sativus]
MISLRMTLLALKRLRSILIRNKLAENEFKLKAYKNSSQVVQDIYEKITKNNKLRIGYEYGRRPGKKTVSDYVGDDTVKPLILRKTAHTKNAVNKAATESFRGTVKRKRKKVTFVTAVKTVEANAAVKGHPTATFECVVNTNDTKSKNRNGKINRGKNDEYPKNAPRKLCNNFGCSHHLTHICRNDAATRINAVNVHGDLHRTPIMDRSMNVCSNIDCMSCKITAMSTVFNLPILSTAKCSHLYDVETLEATKVSFQARY